MKQESAQSALEAVASDPKVAAVVAASTASLGAAARLEVIHGWLSVVSMAVGIVTAFVVLGIQLIRLEKALRDREWAKK